MTTELVELADRLAAEIRRVDGNHSLGAGALAEALVPFVTRALASRAGGSDTEYSQGIMGDGAAILRNGVPMTVDDIVATLNKSITAAPEPVAVGADNSTNDEER